MVVPSSAIVCPTRAHLGREECELISCYYLHHSQRARLVEPQSKLQVRFGTMREEGEFPSRSHPTATVATSFLVVDRNLAGRAAGATLCSFVEVMQALEHGRLRVQSLSSRVAERKCLHITRSTA